VIWTNSETWGRVSAAGLFEADIATAHRYAEASRGRRRGTTGRVMLDATKRPPTEAAYGTTATLHVVQWKSGL
jgi:hypothetical protein